VKNLWQITGACSLITAVLLSLIGEFGYGWICFGLTGIITASCAIRNKWIPTRTVSQWIQDLTTNKALDYSIGAIGIALATWCYFSLYGLEKGMEAAFWPLTVGLLIHFFANKD